MKRRAEAPGVPLIALAGNPNVGKSTLFNQLTGLHQHTGNWPGKTVCVARGLCETEGHALRMIDLPGAYSLMAHSAEEEVARDFLLSGEADAVCVVCDATCLKRNLNLVLQVLEITPRVVVCVNLMDEAQRQGLRIDLPALSRRLGVPVVGASARANRGLRDLVERMGEVARLGNPAPRRPRYPEAIEQAAQRIEHALPPGQPHARWTALRALEQQDKTASAAMVTALYAEAEQICAQAVQPRDAHHFERQLRIDRLLTGRALGIPVMLALLAAVFYITIVGANYPSQWLSDVLLGCEAPLNGLLLRWGLPAQLADFFTAGVYRVAAWVVSVMLPPMAIFFPLFTLLEDLGYLPRVAFNLDSAFRRCRACGKQALCMCMGLGCNAVGVTGCRIIDSPRERLIAILTNSLMPCNGRFPTLITLLNLFFVGAAGGLWGAATGALGLTLLILLGVLATFALSRLLSATLLQGMPSAFTLELPPYRRPQVGKVIVHSVLDRTLFVLGRALAVAAPAGGLIYLMANLAPGGVSLLSRMAGFLDPFAQLMGLDGVLLCAFILGFPANEIVLPLAIMGYLSSGTLAEMDSLAALRQLLLDNGWTSVTAACTLLFSLMHWPCSTTCITIYRETHSIRWTLLAIAAPTLLGISLCMLVNALLR